MSWMRRLGLSEEIGGSVLILVGIAIAIGLLG